MSKPRKYTFPAIDPNDETEKNTIELWIDQAKVEFITRGALGAKFYRMILMKEMVLDRSMLSCIVEGWNRDGYDLGLCYIGRPNRDLPSEGIELPPPPGKLFFVVALPSGKVEDWRWEFFDLDSEDDFRSKFGEGKILWKNM